MTTTTPTNKLDLFKDDKTLPMEKRIIYALIRGDYTDTHEPFRWDELLDKLIWERGKNYVDTMMLFLPELDKLVERGMLGKKEFDTGEGFEIPIYWVKSEA